MDKKAILPVLLTLLKLIEKGSTLGQRFKEFLAPLLVVLKKAIEIASRVDTLDPPQGEVDDVLNPGKCRCKDRFIQPQNEVMK